MVFRRQPWVGYGEVTVANDLAVVVHCVGVSGPAERTQIDHSALSCPQERVITADRRMGIPYDLAASIHIEGGAAGAIERAQVDYSARRRPHECTKRVA